MSGHIINLVKISFRAFYNFNLTKLQFKITKKNFYCLTIKLYTIYK